MCWLDTVPPCTETGMLNILNILAATSHQYE